MNVGASDCSAAWRAAVKQAEALAGLKLTTSRRGAYALPAAKNYTGLLAPFGEAQALAEHVLALLSDPARRRAMGAGGRARVAERYDVNRLVDDIEALYRALLDAKH